MHSGFHGKVDHQNTSISFETCKFFLNFFSFSYARFQRHCFNLVFPTEIKLINSIDFSTTDSIDLLETTESVTFLPADSKIILTNTDQVMMFNTKLQCLEKVSNSEPCLSYSFILNRIVGLTANGLLISIEEQDSYEEILALGGCELENHQHDNLERLENLGDRPKTAVFFNKADKLPTVTITKEDSILGDLRSRRPQSSLVNTDIVNIPANYSIQGLSVENFCYEFF